MTELIGWVANALFFVGAMLLARRSWLGFAAQGWANVLYVVFAVRLGTPALAVLSAVLGLTNVYGIWCWRIRCNSR